MINANTLATFLSRRASLVSGKPPESCLTTWHRRLREEAPPTSLLAMLTGRATKAATAAAVPRTAPVATAPATSIPLACLDPAPCTLHPDPLRVQPMAPTASLPLAIATAAATDAATTAAAMVTAVETGAAATDAATTDAATTDAATTDAATTDAATTDAATTDAATTDAATLTAVETGAAAFAADHAARVSAWHVDGLEAGQAGRLLSQVNAVTREALATSASPSVAVSPVDLVSERCGGSSLRASGRTDVRCGDGCAKLSYPSAGRPRTMPTTITTAVTSATASTSSTTTASSLTFATSATTSATTSVTTSSANSVGSGGKDPATEWAERALHYNGGALAPKAPGPTARGPSAKPVPVPTSAKGKRKASSAPQQQPSAQKPLSAFWSPKPGT